MTEEDKADARAQARRDTVAAAPPSGLLLPPPLSIATKPEHRKLMPLVSGCLWYFPDALAWVSFVSHIGNQQHNPGQPMHWAQAKSGDHLDCIGRHLAGVGTCDTDGVPHSWKLAWRALANLQMEAQKAGAPLPPGAK